MNIQQRYDFFKRLKKENPRPKSELNYSSPFELLVAVVLSAQATDKSVNQATKELFAIAKTPEKILLLGEKKLKKYIQSIGLYNTKGSNIIKMSQRLVDDFHSQVPRKRDDLESLPGVGRKSANIILNTIFHEPVIAVDTHIFRVANRTGLAPGKTVLDVEKKLMKAVPEEFLLHAHHWLVLHGRYVCTARKPHCESCVVEDLCEFKDKNFD